MDKVVTSIKTDPVYSWAIHKSGMPNVGRVNLAQDEDGSIIITPCNIMGAPMHAGICMDGASFKALCQAFLEKNG